MQVRTIEMDYEWQMKQAISELLKNYELSIDNFTPDELMDFLELHSDSFGDIVVQNMAGWTSPDDWVSGIK